MRQYEECEGRRSESVAFPFFFSLSLLEGRVVITVVEKTAAKSKHTGTGRSRGRTFRSNLPEEEEEEQQQEEQEEESLIIIIMRIRRRYTL